MSCLKPEDMDTLITILEEEHFSRSNEEGADAQYIEVASCALSTALAMKARIVELEESLKPFAESCRDNIDCDDDKWRDGDNLWESPAAMSLTAGDLRRARASLKRSAA